MEPGAGKTVTSAMVIKESEARAVLIVAPLSTHTSAWAPTVRQVAGREARIIGNKNKAQKQALADFEWGVEGVYLTTPQFATRYSGVSEWYGDLLILDESHQVTTGGSKSQAVFSGYTVRDNPLRLRFTHRLALSGTPMRQNFANLWGTMRLLWPELDSRPEPAYDNYFVWKKDRMVSEQIITERSWVPVEPGEKLAPEQYRKMIDGVLHKSVVAKTATTFLSEAVPGLLMSQMPCVIVHRKREACCEYHPEGFLAGLPEPQEIPVRVELTAKQRKAITELEKLSVTWLEDQAFVVDMPMTVKMRLRQLCLGEAVVEEYEGFDSEGTPVDKTRLRFEEGCASPFLDATIDILNNMDADEPVVVYLESKRFAKVAVERLRKAGIPTEEYSGDRKADLTRFGKDYRVLVAIISSLGTGTDGLQSVCNTEIYLETPISLTSQEQVQSRLDRMGGKQVQRFVLLDTDGYAEGRFGDLLEKKLAVNASMRKA